MADRKELLIRFEDPNLFWKFKSKTVKEKKSMNSKANELIGEWIDG